MPPRVKYLFIGNGPAVKLIERYSKKFPERIKWLDAVSQNELRFFYQSIDVFILASETKKNWKEQFGRVIPEAFAYRIPVIGSSSGEIPYVVRSGGIIFKEKKLFSLVQSMEKMINNKKAFNLYRKKAYHLYRMEYPWPKIAVQLKNIYLKVLNGK